MATDLLKQYSGFIMLLAVIFAGTVTILMAHGGNPPAAGEVLSNLPAMPNVMGPSNNVNKNNSGGIFNLGGNNAKNNAKPAKPANGIMATVTNAINGVMKPANNAAKKNNLVSPSFKTV